MPKARTQQTTPQNTSRRRRRTGERQQVNERTPGQRQDYVAGADGELDVDASGGDTPEAGTGDQDIDTAGMVPDNTKTKNTGF
jgi:hypothetical protein